MAITVSYAFALLVSFLLTSVHTISLVVALGGAYKSVATYIAVVSLFNVLLAFTWCALFLFAMHFVRKRSLSVVVAPAFVIVTSSLVLPLSVGFNVSMVDWLTDYGRLPEAYSNKDHFTFLFEAGERIYVPCTTALTALMCVCSVTLVRNQHRIAAVVCAGLAALLFLSACAMSV